MLGKIIVIIVILSVVYGAVSGSHMQDIATSVMTSGNDAISLALTLTGTMATWGGIMKVAEDSGLTQKLAKILTPVLKLLFKGLKRDSKALQAIAMNVTANIFGLGNAATPLGIEAMKRLEEEEEPGEKASKNMILLSLLNTSSIEIIPATVIALRIAHGSRAPSEIIPCVIIVSIVSLCICILSAELFENINKRG